MGLHVGTDQLAAAARVNGATGDSSTTPFFRLGLCTATARSGAGVYTLTLGGGTQGLDIAETLVSIQVEAAAPGVFAQYNWASDFVLNVLSFTATAAAGDATAWLAQLRRVRLLG